MLRKMLPSNRKAQLTMQRESSLPTLDELFHRAREPQCPTNEIQNRNLPQMLVVGTSIIPKEQG